MNRRRVQLESECRALEESEVTQIDLGRLEATIPSVARRVRRWVMEGAAEDMELILRALEVQVAASHERVHIEGAIPSLRPEEDLVTIVQTSG